MTDDSTSETNIPVVTLLKVTLTRAIFSSLMVTTSRSAPAHKSELFPPFFHVDNLHLGAKFSPPPTRFFITALTFFPLGSIYLTQLPISNESRTLVGKIEKDDQSSSVHQSRPTPLFVMSNNLGERIIPFMPSHFTTKTLWSEPRVVEVRQRLSTIPGTHCG